MSLIYEALRKSERENNPVSHREIFSTGQERLRASFPVKRFFIFFSMTMLMAIIVLYLVSKKDVKDIPAPSVKSLISADKKIANLPAPEIPAAPETNSATRLPSSVTNPKNSVLSWEEQYSQAMALEDKGFLDKAIELYQETKKTKPNHVPIYMNLGRIYFQKGLTDQAIEEFKKAAALSPSNSKAYNNLGTAYLKKGWNHLAILEYKKALEFDPHYALALYNLSSLYAQAGENENHAMALAYLEEAIRSDPRVRSWAKDDPDFTVLKNLNRFKELTKE